ncbi:hypothetical protein COU54_04080 [Candidatus Pacearchaeota archaeon CG10_big_fil_rev_8_21_14_0_10_31_24]|nr:MAG: hypothetical protein COU54_04080 [Candidatus Pacearchaeota archaeon CG10_big_fil_rev_8_21_14_0_10_31_24]
MSGKKTRDGLDLNRILCVAQEMGVEIRTGGKHPYNLNYKGMRPCPIATSTHAKKMVVPWMAEATGLERTNLYQAIRRGYLN